MNDEGEPGLWPEEESDGPDSGSVDVPAGVRRRRSVDASLTPNARAIALFWSKVVKSPTCWYWTGAISAPDGYGRFNYQRDNRQRTVLAHRFAVELVHGPMDDGVVCEHKCNEPLCVRVHAKHLVQSTYSENVRFAIALGRLSGHTLLDGSGRSRVDRSLAIREALRYGYNEEAILRAKTDPGPDQATLF